MVNDRVIVHYEFSCCDFVTQNLIVRHCWRLCFFFDQQIEDVSHKHEANKAEASPDCFKIAQLPTLTDSRIRIRFHGIRPDYIQQSFVDRPVFLGVCRGILAVSRCGFLLLHEVVPVSPILIIR